MLFSHLGLARFPPKCRLSDSMLSHALILRARSTCPREIVIVSGNPTLVFVIVQLNQNIAIQRLFERVLTSNSTRFLLLFSWPHAQNLKMRLLLFRNFFDGVALGAVLPDPTLPLSPFFFIVTFSQLCATSAGQ